MLETDKERKQPLNLPLCNELLLEAMGWTKQVIKESDDEEFRELDEAMGLYDGLEYWTDQLDRSHRVPPDLATSYDGMKIVEKLVGLDNVENLDLRVKWVGNLREVVSRRCPVNKVGSPICSDVDLLTAGLEELVEAMVMTLCDKKTLKKIRINGPDK